jgi:DNA topoisomerase VI subunit B
VRQLGEFVSKKERRKYRESDFAKYEKLVMAFNEQVEEILEKA